MFEKPRFGRRTAAITAVAAVAVLSMLAGTAASASTGHEGSGGSAPGHGSGAPGQQSKSNVARAVASFDALQANLGTTDGSGLYREQYPVADGDNAYSYEWPFSQVHGAIADLATLHGPTAHRFEQALAAAKTAQEHYWKAEGGTTGLPGYASYAVGQYGTGGDFFYDDNEWVGLLDVQRYLTDHDSAALGKAKQIFDLVVSGWDTDPTHAASGGTFWTQAPWSTDRNTVSNMPAAELGVRLYQITARRAISTGR